MAYGNNPGPASGGGSDDNYYDDAPAKAEAAQSDESKTDDGAMETTIPRSMLMGKSAKPGDEFVFTVTAVHGEEISIKYSTGESKDDTEEGGASSGGAPPPKGDSEMASLMS